jgi:hypothetical protein
VGSMTGQVGKRCSRFAVLGLLGVGVALSAQLSASATTTSIGEAAPPDAPNSCIPSGATSTSLELFQTARADGTSYAVPADGVITSWSFHGSGLQSSLVTLRVYRPHTAMGPDTFSPVADGGPVQGLFGDQEFVFPARLPVRAGDIIGLRSQKLGVVFAGTCASFGGPGDTYRVLQGTAPTAIGVSADYPETSGLKIDVAAQVEPDVDGDGYGDDTQDACPRLASTQAPCPVPNTRITRHPANPTRHRTSRFRFTSNVAGARFRCRLDDNRPHLCTSPFTFRVKPGRHTLRVGAMANQASDPTPATYRWRVLR